MTPNLSSKSLSGLKYNHEIVILFYKAHVSNVCSAVQKELCWALLQVQNKSFFSPNTALNPTGHRSFNIDPDGAKEHGCFWKSNVTQSCWKHCSKWLSKFCLKFIPLVPPHTCSPSHSACRDCVTLEEQEGSKSPDKNHPHKTNTLLPFKGNDSPWPPVPGDFCVWYIF